MHNRTGNWIRLFTALASLVLLLGPATARAQEKPGDKLTYLLVRGDVRPADPGAGGIEVAFGDRMPKAYSEAADDPALTRDLNGTKIRYSVPVNADDWSVQVIRTQKGATPDTRASDKIGYALWLTPTSVRVGDVGDRVVILGFNIVTDAATGRTSINGTELEKFDPDTHQITVRLKQANFPTVAVTKGVKPVKPPTPKYTAAKGAKDADIYLTGSIGAGRGSKPLYTLEAKLAYLRNLRTAGAFGGSVAVTTNQESDFDPDSIRAAAIYEYVHAFRRVPGTGLILRSNVIGGEFNRKNTARNLITGLDGTLVLPSAQLGETIFATVDLTAGFEAGNNYRNKLAPEGLGAFWRPKFGAAAYLLALKTPVFDRISFNVNYEVRLPRSAEIYSEMDGETENFSLTKKPRHRLSTDLNFLFTDAYGLSVQYRYGTLPPAFKLERPNVKLGFVIQLKQVDK